MEEARKLKQAGIEVTTDVVGFDVAKPAEAKRLRAIAEASGGEYSDARTAAALNDYFDQARERVADLSRDAQSDEIDRLRDELNTRSKQGSDARDEQSEAVAERLERELDEARRRLERLDRP